MISLRTRLLIATWIAVLIIGGLCAAITYRVAKRETEEVLDGQMQRVGRIVAARQAGIERPDAMADLPKGYETEDDLFVVVRNAAGEVIYRSRNDIDLPVISTPGFSTTVVGKQPYQVYVIRADDELVAVAQSTEVRRESAAGAALGALLPVILIIPVLGLLITFVIRSQLRPISRIAEAIARRPPLALDPLPTDELPGEIRPLVDEINQLLERQRAAISREQRFLSDAAHALRTPITALQLQVDVLDGSNDPQERAKRYDELRGGIRRVVKLTGQLLALAREESADAGTEAQISLGQALADVHAVYAMVAVEKGVTLTNVAPVNAQVRGSTHQWILILGNLLDNGLRYSPRGGVLEIRSSVKDGSVTVEIRDEGRGLPAEELDRVFERFYRSPNDDTRGNGLGLATVRALLQQIGGRVWLENRKDRKGLVVFVRVPVFAPGASS
ncbi:MAG: ATP-binding protein [Steroidobacterales bacterium]